MQIYFSLKLLLYTYYISGATWAWDEETFGPMTLRFRNPLSKIKCKESWNWDCFKTSDLPNDTNGLQSLVETQAQASLKTFNQMRNLIPCHFTTWYSYWLAVNLPIYPPIVGKIEILHAKYFCLNQINIFHFNCFKFIWVQVMQLSGSFDHINHLWSHFSLSPPSNWTETPTIWLGILELTGSRSVIGQLSLILIYYCLVMIVN